MPTLLEMAIEAAERGDRKFDPGFPCKHGHHALRYTRSTHCVQCVKDRVRAQRRRNRELLAQAEKRSEGG